MKLNIQTLLFIVLAMVGTVSAWAQYQPDTSFGINGLSTTTSFGSTNLHNYGWNHILTRSDGKIYMVGGTNSKLSPYNKSTKICLLNADGSQDMSFGINGYITLTNKPFEECSGGALQNDGKIVLAIRSNCCNTGGLGSYIIRLLPDGNLDNTFNSTGILNLPNNSMVGRLVLKSPDVNGNQTIIVGYMTGNLNVLPSYICQINHNGSYDTSFGTSGVLAINFYNLSSSFTLQPDGKIIANGTSGFPHESYVQRFNTDGSIDNTFNMLTFNWTDSDYDHIFQTKLQTDGKIIGFGHTKHLINGIKGSFIIRLNPDGTYDNTFGTNGMLTIPLINNNTNNILLNAFVEPTGKIKVISVDDRQSNPSFPSPYSGNQYNLSNKISILQYNIDGTLDNSFGTNGRQTIIQAAPSVWSWVELQPDNKLIISGSSTDQYGLSALRLSLSTPTFHYTVACDNTILWTIDNAQGYTQDTILTNQNGDTLTLNSVPQEGDTITLTCTNATGQTISASQVFTMQDAVTPTFTYNFSNNGTSLNVATATNGLPQNLTVSVTPSITAAITHTAATPNHTYNDAFAVANTDITVCVQAVYSGFGGNPLNTVCKELCKTIPAQVCSTMVANIQGSNIQQGQPSVLTASATFTTPTPTAAIYTYAWNDGTTTAALPVNPTTVATYTVMVTSDRGCTATATAHLPTWEITPIDPTITCNTTSLCVPLIVNKPIRDGYALTFQIEIVGPATIQGLPANVIDYSTATPGVMPSGISTYATTSGNSTIISITFGGAINNTINTNGALPNQIGCLNLAMNNAQPNDNITITGTVTEEYYDPITFASQSVTFGLQPATLHILGAPLNGYVQNRNTNTPLHSNMTVVATDANSNTSTATVSTTGNFSIPNGASMNTIAIDRTTPTDGLPTSPLVIGGADANLTQVAIVGNFTPTSIYDYLAMDVNSDGKITSLDATLIQKRRIGTIPNFAGRRWKFVEHNTVLGYTIPIFSSVPPIGFMSVPIIPANLPIGNPFGSCQVLNKTYDGILIGDANNSWTSADESTHRLMTAPNFYMAFNYMKNLGNGWYEIPVTVDTEITSVDITVPILDANIQDIQFLGDSSSAFNPSFNISNRAFDASAFLGSATGIGNCGQSILKFKIQSSTAPQAAWFSNFKAYVAQGLSQSVKATIVTADNACTTIASTVNTDNLLPASSFAVYPNPTQSSITIRTTNIDLLGKPVYVFDVLGRRLHSATLQQTEQNIDLSIFASGMYILQIGSETVKVVKD